MILWLPEGDQGMEDAWQVPLHIISIDCMLEYKYILLDCPLLKRLWLCDMGCVCYGKVQAVGIHKQLGSPLDPVGLKQVLLYFWL